VGPLNNIYQELQQYEDIVRVWEEIPEDVPAVWLGEAGASALILQSPTTRPYGAGCYDVEITRGINGYPENISLISR
jgi:hypothetical protein